MYYDTPLNFLWNKSSKLGHCVFRQGFWLEKCLRTWRFSTSPPELRWIFPRKKRHGSSFFTTPNLEGLSWIPHLEKKNQKKYPNFPRGKNFSHPTRPPTATTRLQFDLAWSRRGYRIGRCGCSEGHWHLGRWYFLGGALGIFGGGI